MRLTGRKKKKTYEFNSVSLTSGRSKYKARTLTGAFTFFGQELFCGTSADVGEHVWTGEFSLAHTVTS